MIAGASVVATTTHIVTESLLSLVSAFLALQLQLLIFPSDPFIGDPLRADQDRTPTVESLHVKPAVGEEVPPEDNASLLSLDVNPSVREGSAAAQADVCEVAHHCGESVPCHRGLGPGHLVAGFEVVVVVEVRVWSKLSSKSQSFVIIRIYQNPLLNNPSPPLP